MVDTLGYEFKRVSVGMLGLDGAVPVQSPSSHSVFLAVPQTKKLHFFNICFYLGSLRPRAIARRLNSLTEVDCHEQYKPCRNAPRANMLVTDCKIASGTMLVRTSDVTRIGVSLVLRTGCGQTQI